MRKSVRRIIVGLGAAFAALCLFVVVGLPIYVFPDVDAPRRVDVVFVLGPINKSNFAAGQNLVERGFAETLLLSTPTDENAELCEAADVIDDDVICFRPEPSTTQGEAQQLAALAKKYKWESVMVVASTPHISRARLLIERCFAGEIAMVSYRTDNRFRIWAEQYIYQTGAFVKALLNPAC